MYVFLCGLAGDATPNHLSGGGVTDPIVRVNQHSVVVLSSVSFTCLKRQVCWQPVLAGMYVMPALGSSHCWWRGSAGAGRCSHISYTHAIVAAVWVVTAVRLDHAHDVLREGGPWVLPCLLASLSVAAHGLLHVESATWRRHVRTCAAPAKCQ